MYSAQTLVDNVKNQARAKNILLRDLLADCDLNVNSLSQISGKKGLSSFSLAKIADYLDCSVDYLLGRTENATSTNSNNTISGNNNIIGNHNSQTITADKLTAQEQQLLAYFRTLGEVDKAKILLYAAEISEINHGKEVL